VGLSICGWSQILAASGKSASTQHSCLQLKKTQFSLLALEIISGVIIRSQLPFMYKHMSFRYVYNQRAGFELSYVVQWDCNFFSDDCFKGLLQLIVFLRKLG
jgi:hypothetical protein